MPLHNTPNQSQLEFTFDEISYGYCSCGCGEKTRLAAKTRTEAGWIKGQPLRYLSGHQFRTHAPDVEPNPSGMCLCNCGEPAPIATKNNLKLGHIAGKPVRFIVGHHNRVRPLRPAEERFFEKVNKNGPIHPVLGTACWDWKGSHDQHGYGHIRINQRAIKAHRFSYELHYGLIPDDLDCLHKCDRPSCCNWAHLFIGDAKDNMDDMREKGRGVEGDQIGNASFTNEMVREFRRHFSQQNITIAAFAAFHDVPMVTMWNLLNHKSYKNA